MLTCCWIRCRPSSCQRGRRCSWPPMWRRPRCRSCRLDTPCTCQQQLLSYWCRCCRCQPSIGHWCVSVLGVAEARWRGSKGEGQCVAGMIWVLGLGWAPWRAAMHFCIVPVPQGVAVHLTNEGGTSHPARPCLCATRPTAREPHQPHHRLTTMQLTARSPVHSQAG